MFEFVYTVNVICADGIARDLEHMGFFISYDLLNYWLAKWTGCDAPNGGVYTYFITAEQNQKNILAKRIKEEEIPANKLCWFGTQQHDNFVTESKSLTLC